MAVQCELCNETPDSCKLGLSCRHWDVGIVCHGNVHIYIHSEQAWASSPPSQIMTLCSSCDVPFMSHNRAWRFDLSLSSSEAPFWIFFCRSVPTLVFLNMFKNVRSAPDRLIIFPLILRLLRGHWRAFSWFPSVHGDVIAFELPPGSVTKRKRAHTKQRSDACR